MSDETMAEQVRSGWMEFRRIVAPIFLLMLTIPLMLGWLVNPMMGVEFLAMLLVNLACACIAFAVYVFVTVEAWKESAVLAALRARHEKLREGLRSARRGNPTTDIHGCAYVHDDPNDPNGEYIRASDVDALLEDE